VACGRLEKVDIGPRLLNYEFFSNTEKLVLRERVCVCVMDGVITVFANDANCHAAFVHYLITYVPPNTFCKLLNVSVYVCVCVCVCLKKKSL
jgi:hypothetical protein